VLPRIDLKKQLGSRPDVDDAYELVTDRMQRALGKLDEERRVPVRRAERPSPTGRTRASQSSEPRNRLLWTPCLDA
jgi:hypothetical protein